MRSASAPDYDGPANLTAAVRVAADPAVAAAALGAVVVLDGTIEAADDVSKTHASAFDTFQSLNRGSLGRIVDGRVELRAERGPRRFVAADRAAERVWLVTATVATDGTPIATLHAAGATGIVVAATGAGNTAAELLEAAVAAMADGVPVVLATRCPAGAASGGYAFPGGGATWLRAGRDPGGPSDRAEGPGRAGAGDGRRTRPGRPRLAPRRPGPHPRCRPPLERPLMPLDVLVTGGRIATLAGPSAVRLGGGGRDHGRPGRLRGDRDRARDAGRSAHAPDRARTPTRSRSRA